MFRFVEDAGDILTHDSECEQNDSSEEKDCYHQCRESGNGVTDNQCLHKDIDQVEQCADRDDASNHCCEPQGHGGVGGDSFNGEAEQFHEVPFRFAGFAVGLLKGNVGFLESDVAI